MKGSENGPAIRPGDGNGSVLVFALRQTSKLKMPKKSAPLSAQQIELIARWIDEGAVWPDSASANIEKGKDHWAFKAPVKPAMPAVSDGSTNPIDAFIAQRLAKAGMKPSPRAQAETLVRRLYLDLIGLLPDADEVESFVRDSSPDKRGKLIARVPSRSSVARGLCRAPSCT